jgi:hypothetical protein
MDGWWLLSIQGMVGLTLVPLALAVYRRKASL